jgi:anti-sigma factor (TIGR02949 family)
MKPIERYTCEDALRRLDEYVDRTLSTDEVVRVEEHLTQCEACASEYRFESTFVREVRNKLRRIKAPADLLARISARLESGS